MASFFMNSASDSSSTKKSSIERSRVAECRVRAVSSTADYLSSRVEYPQVPEYSRVVGCVISPEFSVVWVSGFFNWF